MTHKDLRDDLSSVPIYLSLVEQSRHVCTKLFGPKAQEEGSAPPRLAGLSLIVQPPGSGKSRDAIEAGIQLLSDPSFTGNIFYVTSVKAVLDPQGIEKRFRAAGFGDAFLFLDGNASQIRSAWETVRGRIEQDHPELARSSVFYKLDRWIPKLSLEEWKVDAAQEVDGLERQLRKQIEAAFEKDFRQDLLAKVQADYGLADPGVLLAKQAPDATLEQKEARSRFQSRFHDIAERSAFLQGSSTWSWLPLLYPACESHTKRVFCLSMNKLMASHTPIISKGVPFLGSSMLKDSVIFLDEIDATKKIVQAALLERAVGHQVDLNVLMNELKRSLVQQIPDLEDLLWDLDEIRKEKQLRREFKTAMSRVESAYHLDQAFQYGEEAWAPYLFLSGKRMQYGTGHSLYVSFDQQKRVNRILRLQNGQAVPAGGVPLQQVLVDYREVIWKFVRYLRFLAYRLDRSNRLHNEQAVFSLDPYPCYALESILKNFNIHHPESCRFLEEMARSSLGPLDRLRQKKKKREPAGADSLEEGEETQTFFFYDHGFQLFHLENRETSLMNTRIEAIFFRQTAESFLVQLAQQALVIGMSATAQNETVLTNYAQAYLEAKLGPLFLRLDEPARQQICENYRKKTRDYDRVPITVTFLEPGGSTLEQSLVHSGPRQAALARLLAAIQQANGAEGPEEGFWKERLFHIGQVFRAYLEEDIPTGLLLVNCRFDPAKATSASLSREQVRRLLEIVLQDVKAQRGPVDFDLDTHLFFLYSDLNFDQQKQKALEQASRSQRMLVISTLATMGAGQNLQYSVESIHQQMHYINDLWQSSHKDLDMVYVETPRNILVHIDAIRRCTDHKARAQMLGQYLSQVLELFGAGEIDWKQRDQAILQGLQTSGGHSVSALYQTPSHARALLGLLYQGIGRIARTNLKGERIRIFVQDALLSSAGARLSAESLSGKGPVTPEYEAFLRQFQQRIAQVQSDPRTQAAYRSCQNLQGLLEGFLQENSRGYSRKAMESWQTWRRFVLMHPTIDAALLQAHPEMEPFYMDYPRVAPISYAVHKDHSYQVSVGGRRLGKQITPKEARLSRMLEHVKGFGAYLEAQGIPCQFWQKEKILNPVAFEQVYKGALGEVCTAHLFQQAGWPLEEITEEENYEQFDWRIRGTEVYIDAKNYCTQALPLRKTPEDQEACRKIRQKAAAVQARAAILCVPVRSDARPSTFRVDQTGPIPILYVQGLSGPEGTLHPQVQRFLLEVCHAA